MDAVVESFKPMFIMLGCAFALLVVLRIFLLWWNSPKQKGKRGEKSGIQIDLLIQTSRVTYIVEVKRRLRIGREIEREIADKVAAFPKRRGISIRTALVYEGELDDAVARSGAFDILLPFPRLLGIEH